LRQISLDLGVWMKYRCSWDAENNIRTNFGHRRNIVCVLHRLAEGILPCKLYQINAGLKGIGIDWRERRVVSSLCMDQSVQVRLHPGERRSVKTGRRVKEGSCFLLILFHLYSKHLDWNVLEVLETSR
jgi:hypothetical protein